jgi:hypothetical protein
MPTSVDFAWTPNLDKALANAVGAALYTDVVKNILQPSMAQVPVKTGALRRSAMASKPVVSGTTVSCTVSYDTDYAIYVHENLSAFHPHGNAKYLERPAQAASAGMADRVAALVAKAGL